MLFRALPIPTIPQPLQGAVVKSLTASMFSIALVNWLGWIVPHHAIAGQRHVTIPIPGCRLAVRWEDQHRPKDSGQTPVRLSMLTVFALQREIPNHVPNRKSGCEFTCPTEARNGWKPMFQVGLTTDRTIHKGRQLVALRSTAAIRRSDQGVIRIQKPACHEIIMDRERKDANAMSSQLAMLSQRLDKIQRSSEVPYSGITSAIIVAQNAWFLPDRRLGARALASRPFCTYMVDSWRVSKTARRHAKYAEYSAHGRGFLISEGGRTE